MNSEQPEIQKPKLVDVITNFIPLTACLTVSFFVTNRIGLFLSPTMVGAMLGLWALSTGKMKGLPMPKIIIMFAVCISVAAIADILAILSEIFLFGDAHEDIAGISEGH